MQGKQWGPSKVRSTGDQVLEMSSTDAFKDKERQRKEKKFSGKEYEQLEPSRASKRQRIPNSV